MNLRLTFPWNHKWHPVSWVFRTSLQVHHLWRLSEKFNKTWGTCSQIRGRQKTLRLSCYHLGADGQGKLHDESSFFGSGSVERVFRQNERGQHVQTALTVLPVRNYPLLKPQSHISENPDLSCRNFSNLWIHKQGVPICADETTPWPLRLRWRQEPRRTNTVQCDWQTQPLTCFFCGKCVQWPEMKARKHVTHSRNVWAFLIEATPSFFRASPFISFEPFICSYKLMHITLPWVIQWVCRGIAQQFLSLVWTEPRADSYRSSRGD